MSLSLSLRLEKACAGDDEWTAACSSLLLADMFPGGVQLWPHIFEQPFRVRAEALLVAFFQVPATHVA
jgi:hypothetical protein